MPTTPDVRATARILAHIIGELRRGSEEAVRRYSQRRLLAIFDSVCLAVDFANAHAVIHRDIKPSNVTVGDFGEVYLLDWGIAKVVCEGDLAAEAEDNDGFCSSFRSAPF